ncbi:hypothetical protein ACTJKO_01870 [Curtobacterium sp. 22159]|uniref:hypothetical protein n=1 Tax=Curtobacterium sp. 22159 TaxID=3453882 RepID=UPI003F826A55
MLILDTNVAIDIERFYFGEVRPSADLRELLLAFPNRGRFEHTVDINYGWAVAEATWSRPKRTVDVLRYRRMTHALGTVLDWSPDEVRRAFEARVPPADRDRAWPRKVPLPRIADIPSPEAAISVNYGVLLKTLHVASSYKGLRGKAAERALGEVVDWTRDTLGVFDTYGVQVAVDLLCGDAQRKGAAQRLLKHSGPATAARLRERASNAAWDLLFTRLCDGYTFGLLPMERSATANVVTRNVDLPYLRSIVETLAVFDLGRRSEKAPMSKMTASLASHVDPAAVRGIIEGGLDSVASLARFRRDPEEIARQADAAIADLERALDAAC